MAKVGYSQDEELRDKLRAIWEVFRAHKCSNRERLLAPQARLRAADIAANAVGEAQNQAAQRQSAELQLEHKTRALGLNLSPLPWTEWAGRMAKLEAP